MDLFVKDPKKFKGLPIALKIRGFGGDCELELHPCKAEEIKSWKKDGFLIFDVPAKSFFAEFQFEGLETDDCPEPINADFSASFRIMPGNEDLAEFLLSELDEKNPYTLEDFKQYLIEKCDLKGFIRRILAGSKFNLLEKYGKGAVNWEELGEELPAFLAIDKVHKFEISVPESVSSDAARAVEDDARSAAREFEEMTASFQHEIEQKQLEFQAEMAYADMKEALAQHRHTITLKANERDCERLLQTYINEIKIIEAKVRLEEAKRNTRPEKIKRAAGIFIVILLILAGAVVFGRQKWNEYKLELQKQQPEILVVVTDYKNSKDLFFNSVYKNLPHGSKLTQFVDQDRNQVEFRGCLSKKEREDIVRYLNDCGSKSYFELRSIAPGDLPASAHDLQGYELRMEKEDKIGLSIVVYGQNTQEISDYLYDLCRVSHPVKADDGADVFTITVTPETRRRIDANLKAKFKNFVVFDPGKNQYIVSSPDDNLVHCRITIAGRMSVGNQAFITRNLPGSSREGNVVKVRVSQQDWTHKYRPALTGNPQLEWSDEKYDPSTRIITATIIEKRPVFAYKVTWVSNAPDDARKIADEMAKDKGSFVEAVAHKAQPVGSRYCHVVVVRSYLSAAKQLESWFEKFGFDAEAVSE